MKDHFLNLFNRSVTIRIKCCKRRVIQVNCKILIVDDEANIIDVSKRYLQREGFQVITAMDGVEALGKWRSEEPDLLVLT